MMIKLEDRNSEQFKTQEARFYENCRGINDTIDIYQNDLDNPYTSEYEKQHATQEIKKLEIERQELIDDWKEKHGQYDAKEAYEQCKEAEQTKEQIMEQGMEM